MQVRPRTKRQLFIKKIVSQKNRKIASINRIVKEKLNQIVKISIGLEAKNIAHKQVATVSLTEAKSQRNQSRSAQKRVLKSSAASHRTGGFMNDVRYVMTEIGIKSAETQKELITLWARTTWSTRARLLRQMRAANMELNDDNVVAYISALKVTPQTKHTYIKHMISILTQARKSAIHAQMLAKTLVRAGAMIPTHQACPNYKGPNPVPFAEDDTTNGNRHVSSVQNSIKGWRSGKDAAPGRHNTATRSHYNRLGATYQGNAISTLPPGHVHGNRGDLYQQNIPIPYNLGPCPALQYGDDRANFPIPQDASWPRLQLPQLKAWGDPPSNDPSGGEYAHNRGAFWRSAS